MWTVKLISTANDSQGNPNILEITLQYDCDDGRSEKVVERISNFGIDNIKSIARNGVNYRTQTDTNTQEMKDLLSNPPLGDIDVSIGVVPSLASPAIL